VIDGDEIKYSFEADVYSWSKTAYEILEEREPVPMGTHANDQEQQRDCILRGTSLPFTKTPRAVSACVAQAWNMDPRRRPTFAQVVAYFEEEAHWLPGTNRAEFRAYQAFVTAHEEKRRERSLQTQLQCFADLLSEKFVAARTAQEVLDMADLGDRNTNVAAAILFLMGSFGDRNTLEAVVRLRENVELQWVKLLVKCLSCSTPLDQGAVLEEAGDFAGALRAYMVGGEKGQREAVLRLGALLLVHGCEDAGIWLLEELGSRGSLQANYTLADYFLRWKRDEENAVVYLKRCADPDVNSQFSEPYLILGDIYFRKKSFKVARKWLTMARKIDGGQGPKADIAKALRDRIPQ
jgi:hypothetical protein